MKCKLISENGTPDRKGKKYPVEVYPARVKGFGVIPIKIYFKFRAKGSYWLVEDRSSGTRHLLNCRSHDAARERANQVAEAIAKGKQALLQLSRQDLDSYETAKQAVAPFNVSVHFACQEWAHAKTMLAGRGCVLDAVRFYLEHGGDALTPKSFNEAKEAFLQFKGQQGISTNQQRKIRSRLADNLKLWLAPFRKKSGRLLPEDFDIRTKPNELAKRAGIIWIPDGLRHAFGTFRYATIKNIDVVSDEMGNTREICKKHYINKLVTEQEGSVWFAIKPDNGNVIPMSAGVELNGATRAEPVGSETQTPSTGQP